MVEPIEGVGAVTVHIRDVQAARHFYRDVLGLTESAFSEQANRAVYQLPGTSVSLIVHVMRPDEGGREPGTVTGVVFLHHDVPAAVEEIRTRGGTISAEPFSAPGPSGPILRAVIADPDGNEFLLSTGHR